MPQPPRKRPGRKPVPLRKQVARPSGQPKRPPPPIPFQKPPIRNTPPLLGALYGGLGIAVLIIVIVIAIKNCGGVNVPSGGGGGALPQVDIANAKPCQISDSLRVNMNTQDRVNACIAAKKYAKAKVVQKHGADGENQFGCLDNLWVNESGWSAWALNPSSGAWGIAQILPSVHKDPKVNGKPVKKGDWKSQVEWGLNYIWGRKDYGSPCKAWELWQSRDPHWY